MVDVVNPGVELSYERLFSKQYSTQLSAAYMFDPFGVTGFYRFHGYRLAVEEKHFFRMKDAHKTYVSAEAVYNVVQLGNRYIDDSPDSIYVHKYTATLNIKYGWQTYISKHLMLDIGFGLGVKYFNAKLVYREADPTFDITVPPSPDLSGLASHPGHYFTINIPFNIKIGYSF